MIRQKLPPTFPLRLVLIVSLVLCLCGAGTIIIAILSVKHQTWGYNWGTGFWCGAITLAAGVCGIVASHARDTCSMKTFMIFAVFGGVTSLIMLALSAGGLDTSSGMYADTNTSKHMTLIVHAGCLGISLLQLILFILADGICIYHLLVEKRSTIFSLKTTPGNNPIPIPHRKRSRHSKSSNSSSTPIYHKPKSKHKQKKTKHKSTTQTENIDDLETPLRDNKNSVLTQRRLDSLPNSSPVRDHSNRNSFTTFGHSSVAEQESLIVHPDEDVFTLRSESRASNRDEGHYAQTALFEPPLPIEEDEELPPYEAVDSSPYRVANIVISSSETPSSLRRNKSSPRRRETDVLSSNELSRSGEFVGSQRGRINTRNEIPHGRGENDTPTKRRRTTALYNTLTGDEPVYAVVQPRRSRSADLLSEENDADTADRQGVMLKDFARSSDRISPRAQHSQSFRTANPNREKRLERRNRALSMELKHTNKDQDGEQQNFIKRTPSVDSSNSGLFADKRAMPTKFSLRTPVRQVGTPYIPSVVPVKSISSLPIFQPPPKPPRTHSVTADELKASQADNSVENGDALDNIDCVFIDENIPNHDRSTAAKNKEVTQMMNSEMKVPDSPMIKCLTKPVTDTSTAMSRNINDLDPATESGNKLSNNDSDIKSSMAIPSSPILKKVAVGPSEIKDGNKKITPIPKARTSIKAVINNNKQKKIQDNEDNKESTHITHDSAFNDKNDKVDNAKQSQLTTDDFSVLRVNLPPLKSVSIGSTSPSLKILNRKFPKKVPEIAEKESHEVTNTVVEKVNVAIADSPTITVSRSQSVEYKGARPKTVPRTSSMKDKPSFTVSSNTKLSKPDASPFVRKSDTRTTGALRADTGVRQKQFKSVQKKPLVQKPFSNTKSTENGTYRPVTAARNSPNFTSPSSAHGHNLASPNVTQSMSSSVTGATGYSQGVLRLPQTQYSRHVFAAEVPPSGGNGGNNNVSVNSQNPGNQQNVNTDNLLISKFL